MTDQPIGRKPSKAGRRRLAILLLFALGVAALVYGSVTCIRPASFKAVKAPREGHVMNDRVAVVYSSRYQVELGGAEKLHAFDIRKYAKIYLALNTAGLIRPENVFVPEPADRDSILLVHTAAYLESLKDSKTVAGYLEAPLVAALPAGLVESQILEPFRYATGGTILASRLALEHGIGINIGGGYHHAKPDAGEGFCVYNDLAVAIRVLQRDGLIRRALVVDLDVHQGNGTAVCFAGDEDVFTFSMHQGSIYPVPKETSDLDVELAAGTDDAAYLAVLREQLPGVFDRARPEIVFLQAGCDTLRGDPLAGLVMTKEGIVARDACVVDEAVRRGVPVVVTLGGGYSPKAWDVQFTSVRRTIETYGLAGTRPYPPRRPTTKEKLYAK
jgi:histone deacetylase 11